MRQLIRGYVDGLIEFADAKGDESVSGLSQQLRAVNNVIAGSKDLRDALSNPEIAVSLKRNTLNDLLASHISAPALGLLAFIVGADRAIEIPTNIEWAAARLQDAKNPEQHNYDIVLGLKNAQERLEGYAEAVLGKTAGRHEIEEVEDELFRFSRIVAGSAKLRAALSSRDQTKATRQALVSDLLKDKASARSVALARYGALVGHPRDYENLLAFAIERVSFEANRQLAEVRSAVALDEQQSSKLAVALSRAVGRQVEVRNIIDPSVLGGFLATVADVVVDTTARRQLEVLKERLITTEANITTGESH